MELVAIADDDPAELAQHYQRVGTALHDAGDATRSCWGSFRRINLGEAMRDPAKRSAASDALDALDWQLRVPRTDGDVTAPPLCDGATYESSVADLYVRVGRALVDAGPSAQSCWRTFRTIRLFDALRVPDVQADAIATLEQLQSDLTTGCSLAPGDPHDPDDVVALYEQVGRELHAAGADARAGWTQFRYIRINEALRDPTVRAEALVILRRLHDERALRGGRP
jgi:hypothetical protein